jgi:heterodisulfide reductase subunit A-like polyferredoxin
MDIVDSIIMAGAAATEAAAYIQEQETNKNILVPAQAD